MADTAGPSTSQPVQRPSNADKDSLPEAQPVPCAICTATSAIYTCPRCQIRTCSLPCSNAHKTMGAGCSGIRNKAAYVPMNQYGYMTLMNDYVFLEEVGRKVGDWGREIVTGGYQASAGRGQSDRGRGRGRGPGRGRGMDRGGSHTSGPRTKREVLKMELDLLDIEMDMLSVGMERRTSNQSTWDTINRTALLTVELVFHPPRFLLPSACNYEPIRMLTHKNRLDQSLMTNLVARLHERSQSKKKEKEKPLPEWLTDLVVPPPGDTEGYVPPTCVMPTKLDPLAAVSSSHAYGGLRPGHITQKAFYKLAFDKPLAEVFRHKHFVEFPTVEIWEEGAFTGIVVDDEGSVVHRDSDLDDDDGWRSRKKRKLGTKEGKKALGGMLGGYGSGSEEEDSDDAKEEKNVFNLLAGYAGSDEDEPNAKLGKDRVEEAEEARYDFELGDEDADGVTDDGEDDFEFDDEEDDVEIEDPDALAKLLEQPRQAGALPGPKADLHFTGLEDEDQVDWGESDGE